VGTMTLTIAYGLAWWRFPALQVTWRHFRAKRVGAASEE
jgi:hypothetical protein